jgi:hypothetical protein
MALPWSSSRPVTSSVAPDAAAGLFAAAAVLPRTSMTIKIKTDINLFQLMRSLLSIFNC